MLGIPYAGRMPDFSAGPQPPAQPLSPGTLEQHAIRREQDQAYEESLALDRCACVEWGEGDGWARVRVLWCSGGTGLV